ncbi:MAG: (d)CMP kinase [Candidatus Nanohaloarchaea archaeon]
MESYIEEFQGDHEKNSDLVITVDGKAGAGKGKLGEQIAGVLELEHFSASDVFYSVAEERGLEDFELSDEAEKEVDLAVDRRTLERGLEQDCVIDGRLTGWVLGSNADLRIKVVADEEERARRLAEREDMDAVEARQIVEKRDSRDEERYMDYYGISLEDDEIYDLVIDNTDMNLEEQAEFMRQKLEKRFPERS